MSGYAYDADSGLPERCSTCARGHFEGPSINGEGSVLAVRCDRFEDLRSVDAGPQEEGCWVALTRVTTITDGVRTIPVVRRRRVWPETRADSAREEPWNNPVPPRRRRRSEG